MSYRDLLTYLLSLGPKLKPILESFQRIVDEINVIRGLLSGEETFAMTAPTDEEAALEGQVIAAAMGGEEVFGGPLQNVLDLIRNNPELVALLLKFIK